jgi:hypothetical protein
MLCPCCNGQHWITKEGHVQPCPECGGLGEVHCCEGLSEQPPPEGEPLSPANKADSEP